MHTWRTYLVYLKVYFWFGMAYLVYLKVYFLFGMAYLIYLKCIFDLGWLIWYTWKGIFDFGIAYNNLWQHPLWEASPAPPHLECAAPQPEYCCHRCLYHHCCKKYVDQKLMNYIWQKYIYEDDLIIIFGKYISTMMLW